MSPVPIAPGILTGLPDKPRLLGARCPDCGVVTFPAQASCPRCTGQDMGEVPLARRGTLWTWTTQGFPPKAPPYGIPATPETFEPYLLGYVDLDGEVRVEARLTGVDAAHVEIGMELELTVVPFRTDSDGRQVVIPAFRPAAGAGSG